MLVVYSSDVIIQQTFCNPFKEVVFRYTLMIPRCIANTLNSRLTRHGGLCSAIAKASLFASTVKHCSFPETIQPFKDMGGYPLHAAASNRRLLTHNKRARVVNTQTVVLIFSEF